MEADLERRLVEIHRLKFDLLLELVQLEGGPALVSLLNWIRSDIYVIVYMTRTLGEIIHSLHPKKRARREDGWIWAP